MLSVSVGASAMLKLQGNVSDNIQWVCGRCMVKQREYKCIPFYKDGNKSVMWMSNMCFEKKGGKKGGKYKKDTDGNCGVVVPAFKDYDGDIWKQKTCEDLNFRVGVHATKACAPCCNGATWAGLCKLKDVSNPDDILSDQHPLAKGSPKEER
mmetsp:Transcript_29320/g.51328  ORF Transcript_29320/g.51328 Transcript_29320/m.51328 type:complete len:152 (+) Transcript_29320:165-620(+)